MHDNLTLDAIDERFFVRGRMEIIDVLNDLILRGEPVMLQPADGGAIMAATLLEVREQTLAFDAGHDAALHARLLACAGCGFLAFPDGIRVQFATGTAKQVVPEAPHPIFAVPLPERLARLQRQESFRVRIPQALRIDVALFAADGRELGAWPLHDVSVGGLGIAADAAAHTLGPALARARWALPDHGDIDCQVALRHVTGLPGSTQGMRIGLSFVDLAPAMRVAIQRFIIATQYERQRVSLDHDEFDDA